LKHENGGSWRGGPSEACVIHEETSTHDFMKKQKFSVCAIRIQAMVLQEKKNLLKEELVPSQINLPLLIIQLLLSME
jgi:hypothetical protein